MATDQKGIEITGIGIFYRRMFGQLAELPQRGRPDPQQLADFAGPVDRPRRDPLGQQQGVKLTFGLRQEVEGARPEPECRSDRRRRSLARSIARPATPENP